MKTRSVSAAILSLLRSLILSVVVIQISLRPHTSSETDKRSYILPFNAKVKAALTAWDARLEDSKWEVVYHCAKEIAQLDAKADVHVVQPKFRTSTQLIVPEFSLECSKGEEEREEWDEAVSSILEWSGMACLESQRYFSGLKLPDIGN